MEQSEEVREEAVEVQNFNIPRCEEEYQTIRTPVPQVS
jgi:hypothetical protein